MANELIQPGGGLMDPAHGSLGKSRHAPGSYQLGWQRFVSWEHETLAKLAADLLVDNLRLREELEQKG